MGRKRSNFARRQPDLLMSRQLLMKTIPSMMAKECSPSGCASKYAQVGRSGALVWSALGSRTDSVSDVPPVGGRPIHVVDPAASGRSRWTSRSRVLDRTIGNRPVCAVTTDQHGAKKLTLVIPLV